MEHVPSIDANPPLPDFDSMWNMGKPAETEVAFRAVLTEVGETAPSDYRFELQTQIARTLSLQRKFEEAHALLDSIESADEAKAGRGRMRYLLERGRTLNSSGRKPEALPLFVEAWEIGRDRGEDGLAVDAAHMAAIAEVPAGALEWNLKALELADASAAPAARKWRKSLHNNMGWTYFSTQDYERAMHHFQQSRSAAEEAGDAEAERIARWSIAKTNRMTGQVEVALGMQRRQLAELEAQGREGGFVFEELAECLYALGHTEEAKPYFAKAFAALSNDIWLKADEPERLARLQSLSGQPG